MITIMATNLFRALLPTFMTVGRWVPMATCGRADVDKTRSHGNTQLWVFFGSHKRGGNIRFGGIGNAGKARCEGVGTCGCVPYILYGAVHKDTMVASTDGLLHLVQPRQRFFKSTEFVNLLVEQRVTAFIIAFEMELEGIVVVVGRSDIDLCIVEHLDTQKNPPQST